MNTKISKKDPRDVFPVYSRSKYHSTAKRIRRALNDKQNPSDDDIDIVENWRASHRHILNVWQVILRKRATNTDIVFAQRLKRKNTILNKLCREPNMSLVRMHDIAGCRVIFKNYDDMVRYINSLHSSSKLKHYLTNEYNYIEKSHPKNSGYRGIHDEYEYFSRKASDRSDRWDGLFLEIQYRTIFQHAWATAVEVADMITGNNVKFNCETGDQNEFFRLTSEIIARVYEGQHSCYPELSNIDLADRFEEIERNLGLLNRLKQVKIISPQTRDWKKCIILHFKESDSKLKLETLTFNEFSKANNEYFKLEKQHPDDDIVLVRTDDKSIGQTIRNAFRNYFADTADFIDYVESGIKCLRGEMVITPPAVRETLIPPPLKKKTKDVSDHLEQLELFPI